MGWLIVMFDLPVTEKEQQRTAQRFRKDLLDQGFQMLQASVYAKYGVTLEKVEQYQQRVHAVVPPWGSVIAMFITNQQWAKAEYLTGKIDLKSHKRASAGDEVPDQLLLW
jgi:CRISPR-associated protein Cas2